MQDDDQDSSMEWDVDCEACEWAVRRQYRQEFAKYAHSSKFVATKREISTSPEKQSEKTHGEEYEAEEGYWTLGEKSWDFPFKE